MPSKLINDTLSNLTAGVTQQYEEGAYDSQVREMVNCFPSISRGILRRNPVQGTYQLYTDSTGTTAYTIADDSYVYAYDRGNIEEQYIIVIDRTNLRVYNVHNTDGLPLYVYPIAGTYLEVPITKLPRDSFTMVTIGDHTFIANNTKITSMSPDVPTAAEIAKWDSLAFYWIKKTAGIVVKQTTDTNNNTGSRLEGYKYTLNGTSILGAKETAPLDTTIDWLEADKIAAKFATDLGAPYQAGGNFVVNDAPTSWDWEDSFGNNASLGVWKELDDSSKLPARITTPVGTVALDGFIVRISGGTSSKDDDYFLKYVAANETWEETRSPLTKYKIDSTTMPHVLYRLADGSFVFDEYKVVSDDGLSLLGTAWEERTVGDEITNEGPSFIGKSIDNIFFHKTRLGFITTDSIVLSGTGAYGNFFSQTIQDILDDDPIDLAVATTNVTTLRDVVATSGSLILFSDDAQFELYSDQGPLTPNTADIRAVSKYTFNKGMRPKALGNKVYFTSISGGYAQLFSYKLTDRGAQVTEATPLTTHLPSYIPNTIDRFTGHSVLGYSFIQDYTYKNKLYVLTNTSIGSQELQNAFHLWEFAEDIVSADIIDNNLYILFTSGRLGYITLEVPGDISTVTYGDLYDVVTPYESKVIFNQFFWRDANGKGTSRGRLQLRTLQYTIGDDSSIYETILQNEQLKDVVPTNSIVDTWDDTILWDDTYVWLDVNPIYTRTYRNDDKITIMADTRYATITFKENSEDNLKGFELATVNAEMLYHQRSSRV